MPAYHARTAFVSTENATGRLVVNVLHFEVDTLTSPPNWTSIASDIAFWLAPPYENILSSAYTLNTITVTDSDYPGSTHGQGIANVNVAGTRVPNDTKLDPSICAVGTLQTAVAKRYARGHIFFPPAIDTSTTAAGGIWSTTQAYWTAMQTFLGLLKAGHTVGSTGYVTEVFSRHRVKVGAPDFAYPVTNTVLKQKQHMLRSRQTVP